MEEAEAGVEEVIIPPLLKMSQEQVQVILRLLPALPSDVTDAMKRDTLLDIVL